MIEEITATARGYVICSTKGIEEVLISGFKVFSNAAAFEGYDMIPERELTQHEWFGAEFLAWGPSWGPNFVSKKKPLAFHVGFCTNIICLMGQFAFHMTES